MQEACGLDTPAFKLCRPVGQGTEMAGTSPPIELPRAEPTVPMNLTLQKSCSVRSNPKCEAGLDLNYPLILTSPRELLTLLIQYWEQREFTAGIATLAMALTTNYNKIFVFPVEIPPTCWDLYLATVATKQLIMKRGHPRETGTVRIPLQQHNGKPGLAF
ncbi:unnamed protein product [Pleuronectes platessa]|uniref:Uncharacterized protein n=1 Tax=Pleuronectes platessa TaxID=8262 RepID=A0A9N7YAE2_PLEPL|nr:unnamed protein product [Pleuronectes platessa]